MAVLKLQLLGGFKATTESGQEVVVQARKSRALLAILALSPSGWVSRQRLMNFLWSDRSENQARSSLRQTLTTLRKELVVAGSNLLVANDERVELSTEATEIDTRSLFSLSREADADSLRHAVRLYQGNLLDDASVNDPAFEEWLSNERNRISDLMISVFDRLLLIEPPSKRVEMAKRLLSLDPLRELSHLALMNAYADSGERNMALQHYSACRQLLKSELNVQPNKDIEQLRLRLESAIPEIPVTPRPINIQISNPDAKPQNRPSIAILNFANLSDDPAQRYFSDGITADIVTELSRFHQLLVIAHRSAGNGHSADTLAVGRELAVHFVAEGTVRRRGKRIRITVQVQDVETGGTLWSERFDGDEDDIFETQDNIVRSIVAQLSLRLKTATVEKASRKLPNSMAAYDYVLRGDALPIGIPEAEAQARLLFQKAIEIDPGYARAYAHLATHLTLHWIRELDAPTEILDQALELAKKAVALDDSEQFCQTALAYVYLHRRAHELAEYHYLKGLAFNPNHPALLASLGLFHSFNGKPQRGIECFREAVAINPHFNPSWYWRNLATVYFAAHQYEEAIVAFNRSPTLPDWVQAYLAAANAQLDRMDEARLHAAAALGLSPHFRVRAYMAKEPFRHLADANHLADALRKAGFVD